MEFPNELKADPDADSDVPMGDIAIYLVLWYTFTIITYGVWVPAGLFLPGILIGCSVGVIYMDILINIFGLNINAIGG